MNATMNASRLSTVWEGGTRKSVLEVDFTTRTGSTETVTGPVRGRGFATSTRPRKSGLHVQAVLQALQVCESVEMEFWAVADEPRTYWAVQDGQFFMVHHVPQRAIITVTPVDAWGTPSGDVVELPATEAVR